MLNAIWIGFFLVAFITALVQWLAFGDAEVFSRVTLGTFANATLAFEVALGLTGVLTLWLGIMRIGERGGVIDFLARGLAPLFHRLFPGVPRGHPAVGSMLMNMSANVLGLDNAATPVGLKAMRDLQSLNPIADTASNAQILFLVINTSSVTLFPLTVFVYRAQQGAADPTDVFIPILIATYASTMTGLVATAVVQRINLFEPVVLAYLVGGSAVIGGALYHFAGLPPEQMQQQSSFISHFLIFTLIVSFVAVGWFRGVDVYDAFIDGAKEGFGIAVAIIPYLVAMLVAIGVFRNSGAMDLLLDAMRAVVQAAGMDDRFVEGMPTALMKPLSGSGARGMMVEAMQTHGADSFAGRLASVVQGSTETTFYVLAVYFGSVGIRKARHAVACGLLADVAGIGTAVLVCYMFFG